MNHNRQLANPQNLKNHSTLRPVKRQGWQIAAGRQMTTIPAQFEKTLSAVFDKEAVFGAEDTLTGCLAVVRSVAAFDKSIPDSVLHFDAEYPDHAATSVTTDRSTASTIEIERE